jgi:hypothetical protein
MNHIVQQKNPCSKQTQLQTDIIDEAPSPKMIAITAWKTKKTSLEFLGSSF